MTKKQLAQVRALLATSWTKMRYARNAIGQSCRVEAEEACQFCYLGACHRVNGGYPNGSNSAVAAIENDYAQAIGLKDAFEAIDYNDGLPNVEPLLERIDTYISQLPE